MCLVEGRKVVAVVEVAVEEEVVLLPPLPHLPRLTTRPYCC